MGLAVGVAVAVGMGVRVVVGVVVGVSVAVGPLQEKSSRACSQVSGKLSRTKPWFLQGLDRSLSFTIFTFNCSSNTPEGHADGQCRHTHIAIVCRSLAIFIFWYVAA